MKRYKFFSDQRQFALGHEPIKTVAETRKIWDDIKKSNRDEGFESFIDKEAPDEYLIVDSEGNFYEYSKLEPKLRQFFKNPVDEKETHKTMTIKGRKKSYDIVQFYKYDTKYGDIYLEWTHDGFSGGCIYIALSKDAAKKLGVKF